MSRRHFLPSLAALAVLVATIALAIPKVAAQAEQEPPAVVRVGYGAADATWHVGAGAGQYSAKSTPVYGVEEDPPQSLEDLDPNAHDVDPHAHSTTQADSYGVQSRLSYRAIVVEDAEGGQVAFVKSDSYLAQDYLTRRVGQLLEADPTSEISYDEIMLMASHNHSSPYYTTPSWGVWLFQDAFDLRAFEYHARQMTAAILAAEDDLQDAQMGATTINHDAFKGIIQRAGIADDGSPRGYPRDAGDHGLVVIRFDSLETGLPIATMLNWGQHPEGLDGYDLITGDFVAPLERFVERVTGAPVVFGQGDVGSSEAGPGQPNKVPDGIPRRWSHAGHANGERGAFLLAQDAIKAWNQIGEGNADVLFSSNFDVAAGNAFVPGPLSHPYPSVSNCRTHTTAEGRPGSPVAGLPDCERGNDFFGDPPNEETNMLFENLKAHGIPVPEHYDAPAFTGVEENLRLKLQAFKIGEVILASCACEAQWDLIANLESRLDNVPDNLWNGFDWRTRMDCTPDDVDAPTEWTCTNFNGGETISFSDAAYQRMDAQINNDAAGWNDPEYVAEANAEPADPTLIKGNFTHEELGGLPDTRYEDVLGYTLPVGVGHASDYNGYTVSYREYMSWDDYRKALTSYGPHTADYMNTWLVALGASLNGGPALPPAINDAAAQADEARQLAVSQALGAASEAAYDAWMAALPNDFGPAGVLPDGQGQPSDIQKFEAATFSWRGGSNVADNPTVKVQRLDGLDQAGKPNWVDFADQTGEVQTKLDFPNGADAIIDTYSGNQEWIWTANFEAFDAFPVGIGSTTPGTYRFVVDGRIRTGSQFESYHAESDEFDVAPWDGIEVTNLSTDAAGDVRFELPELYPQTYESVFPYVRVEMENQEGGGPQFCMTCSFRPWATRIDYSEVLVTVTRADGTIEKIAAVFVPALKGQDGNIINPAYWTAATALEAGDQVKIEAGDVSDVYGERNTASVSI